MRGVRIAFAFDCAQAKIASEEANESGFLKILLTERVEKFADEEKSQSKE